MAFKIATYLDRIGLDQVPTTVDGLLALQQAQMRAIPYENIEVLLGDIPDLTENSIWAKLIDARRGSAIRCHPQEAGRDQFLNGLRRKVLVRRLGHFVSTSGSL